MNEKEIKEIIEKGESDRVEFKTSLSEMKKAIETLAAFAWNKGGIVIFGVSRKGEVVGIDIGKGTIENLANNIKQKTEPKLFPSIKVIDISNSNKYIILVEIEKISDEPVSAFGKRGFKRVGKSTHEMSKQEYDRVILEKHKEELRFDNGVCSEASLKDIDKEKVRWFLRKAKYERGLKIDENVPIKEALMKLKLMKDGKLTNSAVLLFGKEPEKWFLQNEVKCILFKGNEPVKPYLDFQTLTGNVIDLVDRAEDFVLRNIKKAIWVEPGKIERQERYEYPEEAIREALVNAVVHRDYRSPSKVQVRVFDDYIEIWNPGKLPEGWTVEKLKKKHDSIPKNPLLFKQLFWIRYVEDVGSGTIDMINECRKWGIPEPEFEFTGTSLVAILRRGILTEELVNKFKLDERKEYILETIKSRGFIKSIDVQKRFNITRDTANKDFNHLIKLKLIERRGVGKSTTYIKK